MNASGNNIEDLLLAGKIPKLDTVHLRNNKIKTLDTSKFNSPGLKFLLLQNNEITHVDLTVPPEKLYRLDLRNNSLTTFNGKDFRVKTLVNLDLSANKLTSFDFSGITQLYSLEMSDNMLNEVDFRELQHLSLNYLGLRNNKIKVVNTMVDKDKFIYLYTIDLSGNQLQSFRITFHDYRFYHNKRLLLNDNQLNKVVFEGSRSYHRWEPLRLENNNLGCFDNSIIDALSPKQLYMSSSNLTFLDLAGFDNLEVLDLSGNSLQTVYGLQGKTFKSVNVGNNPLWCDCYLRNAYERNTTGKPFSFLC